MTLKPEVVGPIPEATIRTARAAFPKGCVVMKLRDEFGLSTTTKTFVIYFPPVASQVFPPGVWHW